jgi:hypothetical protein
LADNCCLADDRCLADKCCLADSCCIVQLRAVFTLSCLLICSLSPAYSSATSSHLPHFDISFPHLLCRPSKCVCPLLPRFCANGLMSIVRLSVHVMRKVGRNHIHTVCTVFLAGKSPDIWSYTVHMYGSGQP